MSDHAIICKLIGFSQRIWDLKRLLKEKTRWFKAVCPAEVLTLPCRWHTSCATAAWCSMLVDKTAAQNQMESLTYSDTISYYSNVLQFQKNRQRWIHLTCWCLLHSYLPAACLHVFRFEVHTMTITNQQPSVIQVTRQVWSTNPCSSPPKRWWTGPSRYCRTFDLVD